MRRLVWISPLLLGAGCLRGTGANDIFACDAGYCTADGQPVALGSTGGTGTAVGGTSGSGTTGTSTTPAGSSSTGSTGGSTRPGASTGSSTGGSQSGTSSGGNSGTSTGGSSATQSGSSSSGTSSAGSTTSGSSGGGSTTTGSTGGASTGGSTTTGSTGGSSTGGTVLYGCDGGCPITVLSAEAKSQPYDLVVSGGWVYWTDQGLNAVMAVPAQGGAPSIVASGQTEPRGLAFDGQGNLYWATAAGDVIDPSVGTVMTIVLDGGGGPQQLSSSMSPNFVAVDSTTVYWTDVSSNIVFAIPPTGGVAAKHLEAGNYVYLPESIVSSGTSVYWANGPCPSPCYSVMAVNLEGDLVPAAVTADQAGANTLVLDTTTNTLYWTETSSGTLNTYDIGTGTASTLLGGLSSPWGVAFDATNLYFTTNSASSVQLIPLGSSGPPTTLYAAPNPGSAYTAIASDGTSIYWADFAGGTIMKLTPP